MNDLQFLTRILRFQTILLTKSDTKMMNKKSESNIAVCHTINRADIRISCRWFSHFTFVCRLNMKKRCCFENSVNGHSDCGSIVTRYWEVGLVDQRQSPLGGILFEGYDFGHCTAHRCAIPRDKSLYYRFLSLIFT